MRFPAGARLEVGLWGTSRAAQGRRDFFAQSAPCLLHECPTCSHLLSPHKLGERGGGLGVNVQPEEMPGLKGSSQPQPMLGSLEKLRLHMATERSLSNPGAPGQGAFPDHPCPERPQCSLGGS